MKNRNEQRALFLLEEIGNTDDRMLNEAMTYRKQRTPVLRWVGAAAACLLAVLLGIVALPHLSKLLHLAPSGNNGAQPLPTLDEMLIDPPLSFSSGAYTKVETVDPFAGACLVWQYENDTAYYQSRPLSADEGKELLLLIGKGTQVSPADPQPLCRVWLITQNAEVYSPYLPATDGTVGYATLFDYRAELLPSRALLELIWDILRT